MIYCLFRKGAYLGVPYLFCTVFRACAPLQKPIGVMFSYTAPCISGHYLSFCTREPALTIPHALRLSCSAFYPISRPPPRRGLCIRGSVNSLKNSTYRTYLYVFVRIVRICTYLYVSYVSYVFYVFYVSYVSCVFVSIFGPLHGVSTCRSDFAGK